MNYYDLGVRSYQCGDYTTSISAFFKHIGQHPLDKPAYIYRGLSYAAEHKYNLAIADYTHVIDLDHRYVLAYYNRGVVYSVKKMYEKAIADYTKCIEIGQSQQLKGTVSGSEQVYYNRGAAYKALGRNQQALDDFSHALSVNPDNIHTLNDRGSVYCQLERFGEALADFNRIVKIDPQYAPAFNNRGIVNLQMKDYLQAEANYETALELAPEDMLTMFNLTYCYHKTGKEEKALECYEEAITFFGTRKQEELLEVFGKKEELDRIRATIDKYRERKRELDMVKKNGGKKDQNIQREVKQLSMMNMHKSVTMADRVNRHRKMMAEKEGNYADLQDRIEELAKKFNEGQKTKGNVDKNHKLTSTQGSMKEGKTKLPLHGQVHKNGPEKGRHKKGKENAGSCGCCSKNGCQIY